MESLIRDLAFAFRTLRRQPAFCRHRGPDDRPRHRRDHRDLQRRQRGAAAAAALHRRRRGWARSGPTSGTATSIDFPLPPGDFLDMRTALTQFDGLAAVNTFRPTIGGDGRGDAEQVTGRRRHDEPVRPAWVIASSSAAASSRTDGTPPPQAPQQRQGRTPAPTPPPLPTIAVLSHEFWHAALRRRRVDRRHDRSSSATAAPNIVGVLAPGFRAAVSARHQRRAAPRHPGRQSRQLRNRLAQQRLRFA